ncbi:MAG: amidohydrolase family protein [Acidimicrobiales bacterium]
MGAPPATATDDPLAGLHIIDTDTHLSEPADLWTSRAPARLRDKVPQQRELAGRNRWVIDGDIDLGGTGAASVVDPDGNKMYGVGWMKLSHTEVHAASSEIPARLEMMDRMGVYAQIMYPNLAGFGNQSFLQVDDPELRLLCAQIYNDAGAEHQEASGDRIYTMALVPWWDIDASVAEVRRCAELGLRGVVTCSNPEDAGLPDLAQPEWAPFFDACAELEMPINFHIGSSQREMDFYGKTSWPSHGNETRLAIGSANLFMGNARVIGNLIYSGVAERHPDCRFVSVESGVGWLPFYLDALDYELAETMPNDAKKLSLLPSEYFKRQFYACFWFERTGLASSIESLGADRVLFETDFPHPTCLYPDNQDHIRESLSQLDGNTRRRVLQDNAAELYRISLPA